MSKENTKKYVKYVGNVLALLSIIFVVYAITQMEVDISSIQNWNEIIVIGILGCILCVLSIGLSILAWQRILEYLADVKIPYSTAYQIFTKANLGKYLPGNVMHYVERNIFAGQIGIGQAEIALTSVLEIVGQAVAAFCISVILSFRILVELVNELLTGKSVAIIVILLILLSVIFWICLKKISKIEILYSKLKKIYFWKMFIVNILLYMMSLLLTGLVMVMLVWALGTFPYRINDVKTTMSAYIVAWFLGFIVPGAPGGIGVKEFVFSVITDGTTVGSVVLLAAVVHRVVTVFGDIISYILGKMFGGRSK